MNIKLKKPISSKISKPKGTIPWYPIPKTLKKYN